MSVPADARRPLRASELARLRAVVAPGSRAVRVRRLRGGIGASTHEVVLALPSGERVSLVLRRYTRATLGSYPTVVDRACRTLAALTPLGLPVPEPLWCDAAGEVLGVPALAMTRLPGRGLLQPRDLHHWMRDLAGALAAIHHAPIGDLAFLPGPDERLQRLFDGTMRHLAGAADPDAAAVRRALVTMRSRLQRQAPALVHGDFWPGNTLWRRGRLTGVVDWDHAAHCDPSLDVGCCRVDLAMLFGPAAAEDFLHAYEAATGGQVADLPLWDLLFAAHDLGDVSSYLRGYHDLGRTDLTAEILRDRLRAFIAGALAAATAGNGAANGRE